MKTKRLTMLRTRIRGRQNTTVDSEKYKEQLTEHELKNFEIEREYCKWANAQLDCNKP